MTDDLGVELTAVKTNIRDVVRHWGMSFGSVFAGTLSFFSEKYFYDTASDYSYKEFHVPWGMNPISDRFLANDTFNFFVDGTECSRTERATTISNWSVAKEDLKVCWQHPDYSKNCGVCEKCIRTMLNSKVVGVDFLPCMPSPLQISQLKKEDLVTQPHVLEFYKECLSYADKNKTLDREWRKTLSDQILIWQSKIEGGQTNSNVIRKLRKLM